MNDSPALATVRMHKIGFAFCEPIAGMAFPLGTPPLGYGLGITEEASANGLHFAWSSAGLEPAKMMLTRYVNAGHEPLTHFYGKHIPNATLAEGVYRGEEDAIVEVFTPNIGIGRYFIAFRPIPFRNELDFDKIAELCQEGGPAFVRLPDDVLSEFALDRA